MPLRGLAAVVAVAALLPVAAVVAQAPASAPANTTPGGKITAAQLKSAIDALGSFDFPVRMEAARTVRRADPAMAVPALLAAVSSATIDWYVRFRALVLLSGFNDPRTRDTMLTMSQDKNDRLRAVAYGWFEHHPDPSVIPRLMAVVDREESDFVRPALTRALAAHAAAGATAGAAPPADVQQALTRLVMSGQDLFRAAVIEALGEYKAGYARPAISDVAKLEGPLQDDAVLAIGRIGDKRGLAVLAGLQRSAPRDLQPSIAAAICLLGSNCESHEGYLFDTIRFAIRNPGHQPLVRASASGLGALAIAGRKTAAAVLFELGIPSRDPERAPMALAVGNIALRNTPLLLSVLESQGDLPAAIDLVRDAFDMLDEDLEEEHFFVRVRRAYWAAAPGSTARKIAETLIQRLEF